jgi:hypothetical protein
MDFRWLVLEMRSRNKLRNILDKFLNESSNPQHQTIEDQGLANTTDVDGSSNATFGVSTKNENGVQFPNGTQIFEV